MTRLTQPSNKLSRTRNLSEAQYEPYLDKTCADMMVRGLKDAIAVIENASKDTDDPDIQNLATNSLPDMRSHLVYLIEYQNR